MRPVSLPEHSDEPLELTREMMVRPKRRDWAHANALLSHVPGCRCSTCRLVADLRRILRDKEGLP